MVSILNKDSIIKETFNTNVRYSCDVLICGGGFAGVSAALAATRQGKKVILLEREFILGGLGTAGLVTIYLPLCDGLGRQVTFGIAEELLRLSISMGHEEGYPYPENWLENNDISKRTNKDNRFAVQYNAHLFAMLVEQLLLNEGVEILYGTHAVAVSKKDRTINSVIIENKSGRSAIVANSVVDATGDCDIAYLAGLETQTFSRGNRLAAWYYYLGENGYNLNMLGCSDISPEYVDVDQTMLVEERFAGIDALEISKMIILSHEQILSDIIEKRKNDQSFIPVTLPTIPQIRMTRKIVGEYILDESESHKYFEDSIGIVSDWRKRGPVFEVPFSTLISSKIKNLIVAGRCTSVTDEMWDIMRVIPCCAVTGQAAGTAAALTNDFSKLNIKELHQILKNEGVIIHESELSN